MAYITSTARPADFTATSAATKPSLIGRFFRIVMEARALQAEREVARYIARTGGKFTDDTEREIERRFMSSNARF